MGGIERHCQCDNCSGIDCVQDDPDRYLEQKMKDEENHDKEVRDQTIKELREKVCDLYDDGMKTPLCTFDVAVFEFRKAHP